jgi:hypothetical protein
MQTQLAGWLLGALLAASVTASAEEKAPIKFDFEQDSPDGPPKGFEFGRTGEGRPGKWVVVAQEGAPGGKHVLVQQDADDTDYRFAVAFTGPELKDLHLSVRCKPISGKVDQGCGLVWRLKDADNYYVARANALEGNVRLYYVKKGKRHQIASWSGNVASGVWHELAIDNVGDQFKVFFNGKQVIEHKDKTLADGGKFGVWTKADSVIAFDDLTATPK